MIKQYRVMVECRVKLWYEVEADNKNDAINDAEASVGNGDTPADLEFIEQFGKAKIESVEKID